MAIRGTLREASLADVLQLLALSGKTGCLAISDRSSFGCVFLERGAVAHASIVNRRDRLGDLLVRGGVLSAEQLREALDAQETRYDLRLGEILLEQGRIGRADLERYLRTQVEEAVYLLFTWREGTFQFTADQRPDGEPVLFALDAQTLLLEGARRVDEWSLIEKKIASPDLVFRLIPPPDGRTGGPLTPEQREVSGLIDGRRSVREIADLASLMEFEVHKALFGLVQAGLAREVGHKPPPDPRAAESARVEELRELASALYRSGMLEEAAAKLRALLELRPDDAAARFRLGVTELRRGHARAAVRSFHSSIEGGGAAGPALHNAALALESLGLLDDALAASEEAIRVMGSCAGPLLSRGILLCKLGRAAEAADAFDGYRGQLSSDASPPAAFYAFAMLAHAAIGESETAHRLADEAVLRHPGSAVVLLHAGALHERRGAWQEAEVLYAASVGRDTALPEARQALGDLLYRRGALAEAAHQYEARLLLADQGAGVAALRLASIRYREGNRAEAIRLWRRTLDLDPANTAARTNLELVERSLGAAGGGAR